MRSLDQPLHIGLAVLLVGGVILFDAAHNVVWESRNKGVGDGVRAAAVGRPGGGVVGRGGVLGLKPCIGSTGAMLLF